MQNALLVRGTRLTTRSTRLPTRSTRLSTCNTRLSTCSTRLSLRLSTCSTGSISVGLFTTDPKNSYYSQKVGNNETQSKTL